MKKKCRVLAERSTLMILFFSFAVLLGSSASPRTAWANSSGTAGYSGNPGTNGGAICTNCHSASGTVPTVALIGPTSLPTGSTSVYTFTITGGAAVVGGLDVSTTGPATLQATDPNTRLAGSEIMHNASVAFTSGSLAFTFALHAPSSEGTITLYASGLSANGTGGTGGDNTASTSLAVNVAGGQVPQIVITDPVTPTTDRQIPFGTVLNNVTSDQTVTVSNSGNANLVVGTIASANPLAAPFSITADNCSGQSIAPAGACTLTVRFAPITSGAVSDDFDIPSNDPTTPSATVSVSGTGSSTAVPQIAITDPFAPTTDLQIPFGTVLNNVTSNQTVTVGNSGNANLVVGQIASANPLAAPFSIMADNCSGQSIAPAGACTLIVRFAPVTSDVFNDTFDIPSNDPTTPTALVSVSGTGNNPPTAPALVSPADGETGVGKTATFEWKTSTDPDGDAITYYLTYCTDRTFESCAHGVTCTGTSGVCFAGSGLLFFGFVMTRGGRGRKYMLMLMMAMLLTTGVFIVSCSSGSDSDNGGGTNMTYQVSGLNNATTYYWRVVADDGKDGQTSSPTRSFTTQ